MKRLLAIIALIVLLALTWCLLPPVHRRVAPSAEPGPQTQVMGTASGDGLGGPVRATGSGGRTPENEFVAQRTDAGAPRELVFNGFVRVADKDGEHRVSARGSLEFVIHRSDGSHTTKSAWIRDDNWVLTVASDAELEPTTLVWSSLTDSHNTIVDRERFRAVDGEGHTVLATLDYGFVVNVMDVDSHKHLAQTMLIIASPVQERFIDTCYPPDILNDAAHLTIGDSPLTLPHLPGMRTGWVRAPGYSWRRFAYSGASGEITLFLRRGASVEVSVTNVPPEFPGSCLHLYALDSGDADSALEPWATAGLGQRGSVVFEGVPPGRALLVVVPNPNTPCTGSRLGEVLAELVPAGKQSITIDLNSPGVTGEYGAIETVIQNANALHSSMARIEIQRSEVADRPPIEHYLDSKRINREGVYTSRCERLRGAEYLVTLIPVGVSDRVTVRPGLVSRVQFDAGACSELRVTVVDPESRRRLGHVEVMYRSSQVRHPQAWVDVEAERETGTYRIRAGRGRITVGISGAGRESVLRDIVLNERDQDLEIELPRERLLPFRVRALQGSTPVPLPERFWHAIHVVPAVADSGKLVGVQLDMQQVASLDAYDAPSAEFCVNRPGIYRLEFSHVMGIHPPPPMLVEVSVTGGPDQVFTVEFD